MARQPYPLQALRQLRDERAEQQAQRLAAQIARSHAAELKLREHEEARRLQLEETAKHLRQERERLVLGLANGRDLLRIADFELAARARAVELERSEAEARQALAQERAEEQKLFAELSAREAEAKLVRNHEASFHERQADLQQKAEEEAALEQWSARRH